jgi:beta-glucosidase
VSSNIDDRTIHELYAWPFANAVKAGVASVMCSYNRLNGTYACENSKALNGILKTELGFQGYVMSDWFATHSGEPSVHAGLDMDMPGGEITPAPTPSYFGDNLKQGVNNGTVTQARLDDMCHRIMTPYFLLRQNEDYPPIDPSEGPLNQELDPPPYVYQIPVGKAANVDVREDHATLIRELGAAGTVLLKNVNGALPLKAPKSIAVLGNDAIDDVNGQYFSGSAFGTNGFEYGTLPVGGGSGMGRFNGLVAPLEAIKARAIQDKTLVQYMGNHTFITGDGLSNLAPSPPDACLLFLKSFAQEGSDRTTLVPDWDSTMVVQAVTAICNNTIVVTHSAGSTVLPWANNTNVTAILAAHLPGEQSGNAIVDVLYGVVNPSGKLPYTIAQSESDFSFAPITNDSSLANTEDSNAWQSDFKEGLLIDYKHFDFNNLSVQYEFGFGLSYTTFNMSNLNVQKVYGGGNITALPGEVNILPGGNPTLWDVLYQAKLTVTNTGQVAGAAVPQIYVSLPKVDGEDPPPVKVLRGFEKVSIQPSQSTMVNFDLMRRDLSYWCAKQQHWVIPQGDIVVMAGFSSRDIQMNSTIKVVNG